MIQHTAAYDTGIHRCGRTFLQEGGDDLDLHIYSVQHLDSTFTWTRCIPSTSPLGRSIRIHPSQPDDTLNEDSNTRLERDRVPSKRRAGVMGDSQNHKYGRGKKMKRKKIWYLVPWTEKTLRSLISFDVSVSCLLG